MAFGNPSPFDSRSSGDVDLANFEILLLDGTSEADDYAALLRQRYRTVNVTPHLHTAVQYLRRASPALVVTEMELHDGSAVDFCREASQRPRRPSILLTATNPDDVPDVLAEGCDGVLLKPFSPNLLVNRVSRLLTSRTLRVRSEELLLKSAYTGRKARHLVERSSLLNAGTNREWPSSHCPYCSHQGVTSFDYVGLRRAWYACPACRKVWIAKLLDM